MKSPFLVKQEFLSPLFCEQIIDSLRYTVPDEDKEGNPVKTVKSSEDVQDTIFPTIEQIIPEVEQYYGIDYAGTEPISFEWYPEGCDGEHPRCENSNYLRKKWLRTRNRDVTGIIFLCEFRDRVPFDNEFEVYGGKLEFPQHRFGFNPQRGTLVLFPSVPHFLNTTTPVLAGDLFQIRFHFAAETPFIYNPSLFPGDFTVWFNEFA